MTSSSPLRSPLSRVRGLGAAGGAVHHWWLQRLTAIALIPLLPWFLYSFLTAMLGASRDVVQVWFHSPVHALGTLLLLTAMFMHARLGLQVVIEDYVHAPCKKHALVVLVWLLCAALTIISWVAVLKMHFSVMM